MQPGCMCSAFAVPVVELRRVPHHVPQAARERDVELSAVGVAGHVDHSLRRAEQLGSSKGMVYVAGYPDSGKLNVSFPGSLRHMVRDSPELDYWDGEG